MVLTLEVLFLFLFRKPLQDRVRIPKTFEEMIFGGGFFSAGMLPDLITLAEEVEAESKAPVLTAVEKSFIDAGLVDLHSIDSSIAVDLKYATEDNFLKTNLYGDLTRCYLHPLVAQKLANAQKLLKEKYPYYSIKIFDGGRPHSIQQKMWNELKVPEHLKDKYVSDPSVGSLHNYGCAVDVTLINEEGWEMDMGTPYDYFGELAHPIAEQRLLSEYRLTWRQFENRKLLREIMTKAGFTIITTEWWHFNGSSLAIATNSYKIVK